MILKYVVMVAFFLAGGAQVLRAQPIVDQFRNFSLPLWMVPAIGLLQIAGAIGLLFESTAFLAAVGLALLMCGAVANHIKVRDPAPMVAPAFLLLVITSLLAYSLWLG